MCYACDSARIVTEHCSSLHSHSLSLSHPLLRLSPSPPTFVLINNCCLHLLSLQNGLTALEVAIASADKDWEDKNVFYWDVEYSELQRVIVHDYDGVIDLLSGYTAEPAVLPGHSVSGTITTSSH